MRTLTATLCLTISVLLGSAGVSWGGTCKFPTFEKFKDAKWTIDKPRYYDDSRLGLSYAFNAPAKTGTLYVYDLGMTSDLETHWKDQFKQAISDIYHRYERQEPDAKLSDPMLVPNRLISRIKFMNNAAFIVVSKKTIFDMTIVSMGVMNGCFFKFRYTQFISSPSKSEIIGGVTGFSEIANSIHNLLLNTDYLQ